MSHAPVTHAMPPADFFVGTWATRITLPVRLDRAQSSVPNQDIELVDDALEIRGRTERSMGIDGGYVDAFFPCAITLPRYRVRGRGNETSLHRLAIMNHLFDEGLLPQVHPFVVRPATQDSFVFSSDTVAIQAGIQMPSPVIDDWPQLTGESAWSVDHDLDGQPGIALVPDLRDGMQPHPASVRNWRIVTLHVALRIRFRLSLKAMGTDRMQGTGDVAGDGVDTHILGVETATADGLIHRERDTLLMCSATRTLRLLADRSRSGSITMVRADTPPSSRTIREMTFS